MTDEQMRGLAREGIGRVQDGLGGLSGDIRTQAKGKANQARGVVEKTVGRVKERAADGVTHARDAATDAYGQLDGMLRKQPLVAIGIGLALGAVIGLLLGESRNRR